MEKEKAKAIKKMGKVELAKKSKEMFGLLCRKCFLMQLRLAKRKMEKNAFSHLCADCKPKVEESWNK